MLEVLIAFTLVALCALPLITPHLAILKAEKNFIDVIEADHLVNLLFANRLQKLYLNEIPWEDIESGKAMPLDSAIEEMGFSSQNLPFTATYQFIERKHKPAEPAAKTIYLYEMSFLFSPRALRSPSQLKAMAYHYLIVIERQKK